jgi:hypothetical protein
MKKKVATHAKKTAASKKVSPKKKVGARKAAPRKKAAQKTATKRKAAANKAPAKRPATQDVPAAADASLQIDGRIAALNDWRGTLLARLRALIKGAEPAVVEAWKWRGVPVWYHHGMLCTGETYKAVVKVTFARGAALPDPAGLFNASLEGNVRRAIDLREGEAFDEAAFVALVRAAAALNAASGVR